MFFSLIEENILYSFCRKKICFCFFVAYDPKKKVLNNPDILYIPQGQLSKSERQMFRQQRRHMKNGGEVRVIFFNLFFNTLSLHSMGFHMFKRMRTVFFIWIRFCRI